jgi:hypothetical protein
MGNHRPGPSLKASLLHFGATLGHSSNGSGEPSNSWAPFTTAGYEEI